LTSQDGKWPPFTTPEWCMQLLKVCCLIRLLNDEIRLNCQLSTVNAIYYVLHVHVPRELLQYHHRLFFFSSSLSLPSFLSSSLPFFSFVCCSYYRWDCPSS
jgi:hypothetical protein